MNLAELMAEFRVQAGDAKTPYIWADASLVIWFNEAEAEGAVRKKLIFDKTTTAICEIAVTDGDEPAVYALDSSIFQIYKAYLLDSESNIIDLNVLNRNEVDRLLDTDWRTTDDKPTALIVDDTTCELNCIPEADYTLKLEVYRRPKTEMDNYTGEDISEPEIDDKHHMYLIPWVKYRAYSVRNAHGYSKSMAKEALEEFEDYFGMKRTANQSKRQNANLPKRNKCFFKI